MVRFHSPAPISVFRRPYFVSRRRTPIKYRKIFRNRNFFVIWLSQIISNFGDRLTVIALTALVFKRAPGSSMGLAKMFIFTILPVFFIGPLAGAYVDRWPRKQTMIISDILRGALVVLIPFFLRISDNLLGVYLVIFLLFSAGRFFLSSKMAIVPDIVSRDNLLLANSLLGNTRAIAAIISLPLAGILVARWGPGTGFYIDGLTFFVSGLMLFLFLTGTPAGGRGESRRGEDIRSLADALTSSLRRPLASEIKEGIRYLFRDEKIRRMAKVFFWLIAVTGAILIVSIVFVQETFASPGDPAAARELGFLGMFLGVGLFLGSLIYGRLGHYLPRMSAIFLSFIFTGAAVILFAITMRLYPSPQAARFLSLAAGLAASPVVISSYTLIHELVPPELQGRIFSSLEIILYLAVLSFIPASILGEFVPKWWIILAGGLFLFIYGLGELWRAAPSGNSPRA